MGRQFSARWVEVDDAPDAEIAVEEAEAVERRRGAGVLRLGGDVVSRVVDVGGLPDLGRTAFAVPELVAGDRYWLL